MLATRQMQAADHERVGDLWVLGGLVQLEYDSLAEIQSVASRNADLCFVAELNGDVVGAVLGLDAGWGGFISRLVVHPDHQGTGLGRHLVQVVEARFRQFRKRGVALLVRRESVDARAFWRAVEYDEYPDLIEVWKYLDDSAIDDGGYIRPSA